MFWFLKNHAYSRVSILRLIAKWGPIGVDIGDDTLKMVQLADNGKSISLIAGSSENRPENVKPGSASWQRWAIEAMHRLTANGKFRGRNVIAAMPAKEVFIDHVKMPTKFPNKSQNARPVPKINDDKLANAVFSKIKQKLPFQPDDAMMKYISTEEDNILVMAVERKIIDRHLALYEKTNLQINSIGVWPVALTNSYTSFFGRRKADIQTIVMLASIEPNCTNVVICRHKNLLFARSIPIGAKQLNGEKVVNRLVLELTACRHQFASMYRKARIERLVFLSCPAVDKNVYTTIAKQLEMPAQMGDCLAAMEIPLCRGHSVIDRRNCKVNWATAFGLSLS